MNEDTLDTTRRILESLLEETDDPEVHYRLRTALQLLVAHEDDLASLEEICRGDDELDERLRELGYVEAISW
jgi:regulator of RNase E activity RraB